MKKRYLFLLLIFALTAASFLFLSSKTTPDKIDPSFSVSDSAVENENPPKNQGVSNQEIQKEFIPPLPDSEKRITRKYFGLYATPQNSPVSPERFTGYHTGIDLEIFPEELEKEISVRAVCSGEIIQKRSASGYGGVAVQSCLLAGSPITVVYGHLRLESIRKNIGENLSQKEEVGILGKAYSAETDGERKHLHLSFHKGMAVNILGYVQNKNQLENWFDPALFIF